MALAYGFGQISTETNIFKSVLGNFNFNSLLFLCNLSKMA
jgi:hypothetical protein